MVHNSRAARSWPAYKNYHLSGLRCGRTRPGNIRRFARRRHSQRRPGFRRLVEQFVDQWAGEKVVGLGQHVSKLWVLVLDGAHGGAGFRADVLASAKREQVIEPRLGRQVEDTGSVVSGGIVHAIAAAGGCAGFRKFDALGQKPDMRKAQKDQAQNRQVKLVEAAGVEPASLTGKPKAPTCLAGV